VKRLAAAFFVSLGIHGLFLFSDLNLSARPKTDLRLPRHLTITLSYTSPPRSLSDSAENPLTQLIKKSEPYKVQQPVQPKIPKPLPQKVVQEALLQESTPESESLRPEPVKPLDGHTTNMPKKAVEAPPVVLYESSVQKLATALPAKPITLKEARPAYRENPTPPYPGSARRRGIEGSVLLEVFVNSNGKVNQVKIFKSSGHGVLDRAALQAVDTWVFEPGLIGNRPVGMWVRVPIRFELK